MFIESILKFDTKFIRYGFKTCSETGNTLTCGWILILLHISLLYRDSKANVSDYISSINHYYIRCIPWAKSAQELKSSSALSFKQLIDKTPVLKLWIERFRLSRKSRRNDALLLVVVNELYIYGCIDIVTTITRLQRVKI